MGPILSLTCRVNFAYAAYSSESYLLDICLRDASEPSIEGQMLLGSQQLVQCVKLRAVADVVPNFLHVLQDAVALDVGRA